MEQVQIRGLQASGGKPESAEKCHDMGCNVRGGNYSYPQCTVNLKLLWRVDFDRSQLKDSNRMVTVGHEGCVN